MRTDWHVQQLDNGDVHLTPNDDQVDHTLDENCICHPTCEAVFRDDGSNGWLYAHHSLDGREHHEPDHNQDNCPLCRTGIHRDTPTDPADPPTS